MAANISIKNGRREAFTALTPAWWDRDGEYTSDRYLTSEEVWGDRGVLDFEYALRPIYDEQGETIPGYWRSVRTDTGRTVGCGMKGNYKIVNPREAFQWMDSLMSTNVMKYASCGVLKQGREIWILGVVPDAEETPISGERHDKYILWTDRFDGMGSLKWFGCTTRVECSNTLTLALNERDSQIFKGIKHQGDMQAKLTAARQAIIDAKQAFVKYNADCLRLIETRYTDDDAREFMERLIPDPGKDASQRRRTIRERKLQAVRNAYRDSTNNLGEMGGTFYQLANSISFAVDHLDVFSFRGRGNDRQDNRFISLMTGNGAKLKRQAFDLALDMAT